MHPHVPTLAAVLILAAAPALPALPALPAQVTQAQATQAQATQVQATQVRVTPAKLNLRVGQSAQLAAQALDAGGRPIDTAVFFFSRDRRSVTVDQHGKVTALRPGSFQVVARVAGAGGRAGRGGVSALVPVTVAFPQPTRIEFRTPIDTLHAHVTRTLQAVAVDQNGAVRADLRPQLSSSDPAIASVDEFGNVTGHRPGSCRIRARLDDITTETGIRVVANPVRSIRLAATPGQTPVRTGDVVRFTATTLAADEQEVRGVPVHLTFAARPSDDLGNGASGQIEQDGRFVAEQPGLYTIVASCGGIVARRTVEVVARNVGQRLELVGHGAVLDVHTSDLWVWEGVDGRDYAVTGTWGANGEAIFWDVTEPAKMERIATVKVDARTVNDVKVSKDGRLCVLSREGASNRKNGIILLDVSNPRSPKMLSTFTDKLTGGVHNVFIDKQYVYALSAARRYDIIDIKDPAAPVRVASYEVDAPSHSIHDVWVQDGIAYSSNWRHGVHLVDVGNGIKGGSPRNPVKIASYAYPSGWNHAAFPYKSRQTGKFYVVAGDEAFPYGLSTREKPTYPRGWLHFIDFTDLENPREVARYQVPEAGTHNLWIEGDLLYAAYYNGGLRVVDISGELLGDLYRQGREIAWFLPTHHRGVVPNAPMTWGPQPHKGRIFFSDWNSGLWCVRLVPGRAGR